MPLVRKTERVVVVRTDKDGNILDYDVVEQPIRPVMSEKSPSVSRSSSFRQSPRVSRMEIPDNEEEEDDNGDDDDDIDYEEKENKDNTTVHSVPTRRTYQNTSEQKKRSKPRRVRYVRPKSTVQIFEERVEWNANKKIDTHNDDAIKRIYNAPKSKIFREKLDWHVKPRVHTHNEKAIESARRSSTKRQIFSEKPAWNVESKIDSHNEKFVENHRRSPKPQIYEEKLKWTAETKIDSHNEEFVERLKSAPKPQIHDEKFSWQSTPRIDHHNEEYLKHKEREKIILREKSFVQNHPHEWKPRPDRPRIDHHNPEYNEHKKRQKSAILPPIEDRKLEWQKKTRINQRNDDYIERLVQKRSIPLIFREKLRWNTKTPKINAHNEDYLENLKDQPRPKIISQLPRWKSQSKIDTHNESYESVTYEKPTILSEKLRWHARPKIDTGLEPDSEEEEYDDNESSV